MNIIFGILDLIFVAWEDFWWLFGLIGIILISLAVALVYPLWIGDIEHTPVAIDPAQPYFAIEGMVPEAVIPKDESTVQLRVSPGSRLAEASIWANPQPVTQTISLTQTTALVPVSSAPITDTLPFTATVCLGLSLDPVGNKHCESQTQTVTTFREPMYFDMRFVPLDTTEDFVTVTLTLECGQWIRLTDVGLPVNWLSATVRVIIAILASILGVFNTLGAALRVFAG